MNETTVTWSALCVGLLSSASEENSMPTKAMRLIVAASLGYRIPNLVEYEFVTESIFEEVHIAGSNPLVDTWAQSGACLPA